MSRPALKTTIIVARDRSPQAQGELIIRVDDDRIWHLVKVLPSRDDHLINLALARPKIWEIRGMIFVKPPPDTKNPPKSREAESSNDVVNKFTNKSPDGLKNGGVMRGRKVPISVTVPGMMLEGLDVMAKSLGQSRAALINLAIAKLLRDGLNPAKDS
jgi:hypothetical protein